MSPKQVRNGPTEDRCGTDGQKDALNTKIPAGRMGEGEDIAAATVFLASKEAGYITGQTIHVNGGMVMV